jgi:hypothetical protein
MRLILGARKGSSSTPMRWRDRWPAYRPRPKVAKLGSSELGRVHAAAAQAFGPFGSFGGTCLYAQVGGEWGCYSIKRSESGSIASAEAWLIKRDWEDWG